MSFFAKMTEEILFKDSAGCRLIIRESALGPNLFVIQTNKIIDKKIVPCAVDISHYELDELKEKLSKFPKEIIL